MTAKAWGLAAAYLAVCLLGGGLYIRRASEAVETQRHARDTLNDEVRDLRSVANQRLDLEERLSNLRSCVGKYVTILPPPELATPERILEQVQQHCDTSGVQIENFEKGRRPRRKGKRKYAFTEVPLKLTLRGTHHEFLEFVNLLEREKALIRVNTFTLSSTGGLTDDGLAPLRVQLAVSTFRYEA